MKIDEAALNGIADSSLLLLGDILPTGTFAALQVLQHPKLRPLLTGLPYPMLGELGTRSAAAMATEDRVPTFAIVGLGPVGLV